MKTPPPRGVFFLALAACFLWGTGGRARGAEDPGKDAGKEKRGGKIVREIEIVGTKRTNPQMIRRVMHTRVGKPLNKEELIKDLHRIWDLGFFTPDGVKRHLEEKEDGYYILIAVKEREYVTAVEFKGNTAFDDEDLAQKIKTRAGGFLFEYFVEKRDIELIRELYRSKAYYNVAVRSSVRKAEGGVVVTYTITENERAKIQSVEFVGNATVREYELKRVMETDFYGFFPDRIYREKIFENDLENIRRLYRSKGFLEVEVDYRVAFAVKGSPPPRERVIAEEKKEQHYEVPGKPVGIYIWVLVTEGPRYRFGKIGIVGNKEEIVPASRIRKELSAKEGETYSLPKIRRDIAAVMKIYGDEGYAFARVRHEEHYDFKNHTVDVTYMIREGDLCYIQDIQVIGNTHTKVQVILREMDIARGDRYSRSKEIEAYRALLRLGIFKRVNVYHKPGSVPDLVIIVVEVEEDRTGAFEVMLSYTDYQGLGGTLVLKQNNFDVLGMFKGRFTGAAHRISLQYFGSPVQEELSLSFTNPRIFDGKYTFSLSVMDRVREYTEYSEDAVIDYFSIGREVMKNLYVGMGFAFKDIDIFDVGDASLVIKQEEGLTKIRSVSLTASLNKLIYYVPGFPGEGFRMGGEVEYAGDFLNATTEFVTVSGSFVWYHTLHEREDGARTIWKVRLRGKAANEIGDAVRVPLSERVALGGTYTVRGYEWYSIGPYENGENVRGDVYALFSTEFVYPLKWDPVRRKNLVHAVFYFDAGSVWTEVRPALDDFRDLDFADVRSSVGLGLRLFPGGMPIPIEIYWSLPFARPGDRTSRLQIGIFGMAF